MAHLLVEERVEGLAVHLRLELLLPLRVRHQEHLKEGGRDQTIRELLAFAFFILVGLFSDRARGE